MTIQSYFKKLDKYKINNLNLHLEKLEKEQQKRKLHNQQKERHHKDHSKSKRNINDKTIAKISETKSWFFKKISKIDKHLAIFNKKKAGGEENTQINKIRNEREIKTNTIEIQGS